MMAIIQKEDKKKIKESELKSEIEYLRYSTEFRARMSKVPQEQLEEDRRVVRERSREDSMHRKNNLDRSKFEDSLRSNDIFGETSSRVTWKQGEQDHLQQQPP